MTDIPIDVEDPHMPRIHIDRLKMIVRQEVFRNRMLHEGEDRKVALDHAALAAKCLDAIEKYKDGASAKAMGEMEEAFKTVEQVLNRVVSSPMQYADVLKDYEPEEIESGDEAGLDVGGTPKPVQKKSIKPNLV